MTVNVGCEESSRFISSQIIILLYLFHFYKKYV